MSLFTSDTGKAAWRGSGNAPSMPEVYRSVAIPKSKSFWRKLLAFSGPGYLVAVGYMDPGNWATDIAGGSKFNYTLLSIVLISSVMAMLLQALSARLGIVTGKDLAQACRDHYAKPVAVMLWLLCEAAIAACDLAEVIGSAIALQLLFHIPLVFGVLLTSLDVLLVLILQHRGFRYVEAIVFVLILTVAGCFTLELILAQPELGPMLQGLVPSKEIITNKEMLYISIGILGATIMPHNLYLHSSIVQTRDFGDGIEGKREAIKFSIIDSTFALFGAFFINAAILILGAATFYRSGHSEVAEIQDAYQLLSPLLGSGVASVLFAVALLASGQNATITGTMAGQIVMEGFLHFSIAPWLRRLITRLLAIIPAIIITILYGESGTAKLLVFSQVILSFQLAFAVFPLVQFVSERKKMGEFTISLPLQIICWTIAVIIAVLNVWLLWQAIFG